MRTRERGGGWYAVDLAAAFRIAALATLGLGVFCAFLALEPAASRLLILAAAATFVSLGVTLTLSVLVPRTPRAGRRGGAVAEPSPSSPLPSWTRTLRSDLRTQLDEVVDGLESSRMLAQRSAEEARREASDARSGARQAVVLAVTAEEQVRSRMVSDLHDGVAQMLIASVWSLQDPTAPRQDVVSYLQETERELRDLMVFSVPPRLRSNSLAWCVKDLASTVRQRRGIDVKVVVDGDHDGDLPEAVALTAYRFVQESLINAAKHSGAPEAIVHLELEADRLEVAVSDTGSGFDPSEVSLDPTSGSGIGLGQMHERVERVGGALTIDSEPGRGTTLGLRIDELSLMPGRRTPFQDPMPDVE